MEIHIRDFNTSSLDEELEKTLKSHDLHEVYYFSKIFQHWDVIVGDPLSLKTAPKLLTKRTLVITVEDATYAHHLGYFTDTIIAHIASPAICGENVVKCIKFRVGVVKPNRFIVFKEIKTNWNAIVNSPLADNCTVEQLLDDHLIIFVPAFYYNDVKSIEKSILKRIDQICGAKGIVKKIVFRKIKNSEAFRDGIIGREAFGRAMRKNAQNLDVFATRQHSALNRISDSKLKKQFAKMMKSALSVRNKK